MALVAEFRDFLKEYKIVGLAVAFAIGAALTKLVQSMVNDIIMPFLTPFVPGGAWEAAKLAIGPILISWGSFASNALNFLIIALFVFLFAKVVLKEEKVARK